VTLSGYLPIAAATTQRKPSNREIVSNDEACD